MVDTCFNYVHPDTGCYVEVTVMQTACTVQGRPTSRPAVSALVMSPKSRFDGLVESGLCDRSRFFETREAARAFAAEVARAYGLTIDPGLVRRTRRWSVGQKKV